MIIARPIEPSEWRLYRDIRLQALRDSPDAFASTYEGEAFRADETWSARLIAAAASSTDRAFFACRDTDVCGLVWCKRLTAQSASADLLQLWVAPASRGLGIGRALLMNALAWAQALGVQRVRLGVTLAQTPAMHLYQRCGFVPMGTAQALREGSALLSQDMILDLKPAAPAA